jgi:large subunit ribosomal protein L32
MNQALPVHLHDGCGPTGSPNKQRRNTMSVPKKKVSKSKRDMRRGGHALTAPTSIHSCPQCGVKIAYHRICDECGYYKGKEVVSIPLE